MNRALFVSLAVWTMLVGCSGDNGYTNNVDPVDPPPANMDITAANAVLVSKVSYAAVLVSGGLGDLSGETGIIAAGPNGVAKVGSDMLASANSTVNAAQVPLPDQVTPCDGGGTVTFSADIADIVNFTLSQGDTFGVAFDMCNDGLGSITDGSISYVVDAFAGDFLLQLYDMTMTMTLSNFQVATAADVLTSNGDVSVTLNTLNTPAVSAAVSGNSLTVDANASFETMIAFASTQTLDAGIFPSPFTMTSSGTLDSSQLSGVVQYSTSLMFEGFDADYPHTGELFIIGTSSSVRLIAVDNVNVRIEIDTDGDGTVDETILITWAELAGA